MATEPFDEISIFKESLRVAYDEMVRAAEGLSPYLQHTCAYNKTNSAKGDVCTCKMVAAIRRANLALEGIGALIR
jgi:hypothetical protein